MKSQRTLLMMIMSLILSAGFRIQRSCKLNAQLHLNSYIDANSELEGSISINDGLGLEKILFVDEDLIIVDKAVNTQTAPGFVESNSLATSISAQFNIERIDQMIVHRLDYATSGVIVFARNIDSLRSLHDQFRRRVNVFKRYSAIVNGTLADLEGEVNARLGRDVELGPPLQKVITDETMGKECITQYKVFELGKYKTHVHLYPKTGRTHQLRVHMKYIGHPILGDFFYSPPELFKLSKNRLLLHAEELHFKHPRTKIDMKIIAPCPFSLADYDTI